MDRCEDNPITIDANPKRVRVLFNGRVIADSTGVHTLHEPGRPAAVYIPRADADMAILERTDFRSLLRLRKSVLRLPRAMPPTTRSA
jgi:uncharacterized protein (DUF427 family)